MSPQTQASEIIALKARTVSNPHPTQASKTASLRTPIFFLLITALLLRLLMALSLAHSDPAFWFYNQATELHCLAGSLNSGHGFASPFCGSTGPSAFLAPGYPLFVALVFRLFGPFTPASTALLVSIQLLFSLATVLVLIALTRRLFGSTAAIAAGLLIAVSPTMIWLPILFWDTTLSVLFLTSAVALALHCADAPTKRNWAALGTLNAAAMLVNPSLTLTLLAVTAWAAWQTRSTSRQAILLGLALWIALYSAWPIRNAIQLHAFVPLRSNLGYELWQGNQPASDGRFHLRFHPSVNRAEHHRYATLGELPYMREKSAAALATIKADPARFARLTLTRIAQFWIGVAPAHSSTLEIVNLTITSVLSLTGLILLWKNRPTALSTSGRSEAILLALPFLLFPIPYYLTHADFRFRILLEPLALMLSVHAIRSAHQRYATRY